MVIIKSFTKIITCCCFHNWLEIFRYISAFLISLSLLVNIPFSNSLGSNTWGDKMADWQSCFTIVDRSLIRERVQISASGHDTDQLGADFFRSCFQSLPNETELATGQNSLSGQLTEVIKSWLIICQRLSRVEIVGHATLLTNIIIGQCLCQQKQSANDWVFNAQTGWVRPSVYHHIVSCLSKMCIVSKKISDKCLRRRVLMEDNTRQHEEFLYRASLSKRGRTECIYDLWIQNAWLKNPCWRNFKIF